MEEFTDYLEKALDAFINDPADSDYQRGYLSALKEISKNFLEMTEE